MAQVGRGVYKDGTRGEGGRFQRTTRTRRRKNKKKKILQQTKRTPNLRASTNIPSPQFIGSHPSHHGVSSVARRTPRLAYSFFTTPLTTESPTTHYCTVQHHVPIDPYAERCCLVSSTAHSFPSTPPRPPRARARSGCPRAHCSACFAAAARRCFAAWCGTAASCPRSVRRGATRGRAKTRTAGTAAWTMAASAPTPSQATAPSGATCTRARSPSA